MFKIWADQSGGMLGRTPDYLNAILAGLASARGYFERNGPEYGERIVAYYESCRERDLCATHTFVDPQINRARTQTEQKDPDAPLHIVGESRAGLVVSGARMLATLAPYADELMVFPSPSRTHPADAPRYAFALVSKTFGVTATSMADPNVIGSAAVRVARIRAGHSPADLQEVARKLTGAFRARRGVGP